jgi:hypothetical protein
MNVSKIRGMFLLGAAIAAIDLLSAGCGGCKTGGRNACQPLVRAVREAARSEEVSPGATAPAAGEGRR